jgi:hypothetical protein
MAGYKVMDFEELRHLHTDSLTKTGEFLRRLRLLVGPVILSSSDSRYVEPLTKLMFEACIDIAANAVRKYPYGLHDRFDSDEKRCFYEIIMTFIDFKWPERTKKK